MRRQHGPWAFGWMLAVYASGGLTQVTLDGTLGPAGALPGPDYQIGADLGRQVGGNLFHSFGQFSIHTGESATFSGPNSVNNIIGRVTGGNESFIDGTLRSTIPGANLYLLNPAGVLFGEHARLDVPGSVHVSTADYLRLSDGGWFDARTPANSVLTVAPVAAFGFLGGTPGRITVEGAFLQVPEGQTLSLIGGDITLTNATVYAPAGRINLASVSSAGEVIPTATGLNLNGFTRRGNINVYHDPAVTRPKANGHLLGDVDTSGRGGGAIFIHGGDLRAEGGWLFANTFGDQAGIAIDIALTGELALTEGGWISAQTSGEGSGADITLDVGSLDLRGGSQISANTVGVGRGGDIAITARDAVTISGTDLNGFPSGLLAGAVDNSTGDAGSITLNVGRLELSGGGMIKTNTHGAGRGGDITITARDAVTISGTNPSGEYSGMFADSYSTGDAGSITLNVGRLELSGGGIITTNTHGAGRGGDITVNANEAVTIAGFSNLGAGPNWNTGTVGAGTIKITTPQLILYDGSIISPTFGKSDGGSIELNVERLILTGGSDIITSTYGSGNAGEIIINASEAVVITSAIDRNFSTLSSNAGENSTGNAGMIRITTPLLTLGKGGGINSSTYKGSTGNGGTIDLEVGRLNLTGGGSIFAGTSGSGHGGEIIVNASEGVTITGAIDDFGLPFGGLSTNADNESTGDAGAIRITTPLLALKGGHISSSTAGTGNGGAIELNVGRLSLTGGSTILAVSIPFLTSGISELGEGGEIIVNASEGVTITDTSALSTNAGGTTGNAGNITVTTPNLILADGGKISAKSTYTTGGNILINADHLKLLNNDTISSSVFGNEQSDGGNVTINSTNFVALNGSSVTAQANQGRGGNILVNAQVFLHDAADVNDVLNASSQVEGNDGTVQNNAPTTDISGSLVALNTNYLDAAGQLTHRCAEGDRDSRSRFTIQGRGALPPTPDGALPAPAVRCETPPATALPVTTESPGAGSSRSVTITQSFGFGDR